MKLFMEPYKWLVFSKRYKSFSVPANLNLLPDSRFWSMQTRDNTTYFAKCLYKYSAMDQSYVEWDVGFWNADTGFVFDRNQTLARKRIDLNGALVRISFVVTKNETLNHLWDYRLHEFLCIFPLYKSKLLDIAT